MKFILWMCAILLAIIVILYLLYIILAKKLLNINNKIYSYYEENNLKERNVLIVYQPSKHKTTKNIVKIIKEELDKENFGYKVHTLASSNDSYADYKKVIFVIPVYFKSVNNHFLELIKNKKIPNMLIIYNGLNKEDNSEDELVKKVSISKYNKIKLHTTDLDDVREFISREVKWWIRLFV